MLNFANTLAIEYIHTLLSGIRNVWINESNKILNKALRKKITLPNTTNSKVVIIKELSIKRKPISYIFTGRNKSSVT